MDAIRLAKHLKALADSGDDFETQLAKTRLNEVIKKYNLADSDLNDDVCDYHDFRFSYPWEQKLLWQIAYKVTGSRRNCYGRKTTRKLKVVVVHCTESQAVEIDFLYSFYRDVFSRDLDMLFSAFVQKHELFSDSEEEDDEYNQTTHVKKEDLRRMWQIASSLSDADPTRCLPDSEE